MIPGLGFRFLYGIAVVLWFTTFLSALELPAHAYVDPGTGLFILQMLTSTFAGIMFMLRRRIRDMFAKVTGRGRNEIADR